MGHGLWSIHVISLYLRLELREYIHNNNFDQKKQVSSTLA